jgi:hypothetical protein
MQKEEGKMKKKYYRNCSVLPPLVGFILLSAFFLLPSAFGQSTPVAPASQAEVNAGVVTKKYVSPATLAGASNLPSTVLSAPATVAWSGPTNTITVSYPWTDYTLYSVTSDAQITNIVGWVSGKRMRASLQFTNATTSNCTIRLPAQWKRFGTALATNSFSLTNGGAMAKLDVEAGALTNAVGAYSQ